MTPTQKREILRDKIEKALKVIDDVSDDLIEKCYASIMHFERESRKLSAKTMTAKELNSIIVEGFLRFGEKKAE